MGDGKNDLTQWELLWERVKRNKHQYTKATSAILATAIYAPVLGNVNWAVSRLDYGFAR